MENNTYEIHYDEGSDYLELFFGDPSVCYAEEPEEGVFIRKDKKTGIIKSIGILSFKKRAAMLRRILLKANINIPLKIELAV